MITATAVAEILSPAGLDRARLRALRQGPRPALGRLRPIKDAFCARFGDGPGARAYSRLVGADAGAVERMPLAGLLDHARSHAADFAVVAPARAVRMPPVPVFGDPTRDGFDAVTRTVFRCVLEDAVVSSKSNVVIAGGHALLDLQDDEATRVPLDLAVDPVLFAPDADGTAATVAIGRGAFDAPPMDAAFTLLGVNDFNYWHWHVEFLPRLLACLDAPGFAGVPILVDRQMPAQALVALRFALDGRPHPLRIVEPGEAVRVRRLWTAAMYLYLPLWPRSGVEYAPRTMSVDPDAFVAALSPWERPLRALGPGRGTRRLYLARHASQHRAMANKDEVDAWFAAQGFESVDFGAHSFEDQLRMVRDAEMIVGPNGAALVNSFFAGPGTAIGILDNRFVEDNEWYDAVSTALGQNLSFLVGETIDADPVYEFNANYRIDVGRLPAFLDHLLGGRQRASR